MQSRFLYLTDDAILLAISRLQGGERGQESADLVLRAGSGPRMLLWYINSSPRALAVPAGEPVAT